MDGGAARPTHFSVDGLHTFPRAPAPRPRKPSVLTGELALRVLIEPLGVRRLFDGRPGAYGGHVRNTPLPKGRPSERVPSSIWSHSGPATQRA
jgi:hypothetical protein